MDIGDLLYTGCEEAYRESDEHVIKMPSWTRAASLSNQIHTALERHCRKPWKSGPTFGFWLQIRANELSTFSAAPEILLWKTRKQNLLPFTFLMRISIALCQTEQVNVVL